MRKLIPNDITVSEQHAHRDQFMSMVRRWSDSYEKYDVDALLEDSGVKCYYVRAISMQCLAGFEVVDEQKYMWFKLKWS